MKKMLFSIFISIVALPSLAQKKATTHIGASYAFESNVGFHGIMINLEEEIKLKKPLSALLGLNFFNSNYIPDRQVGQNQFNRSLISDLGLQLKFNPEKFNGFLINGGLSMRLSHIRSTSYYQTDSKGNHYNINYFEGKDAGFGCKIGVGYRFSLTKKLTSDIYLDYRTMDVKPEPTFLNIGYKLGF